MALLTLERSASLASYSDSEESDGNEAEDCVSELSASDSFSSAKGKLVRLRSPSFEGYFASCGGVISLSHQSPSRHVTDSGCGELQAHLQSIVSLLRDDDVLKMAVRLESSNPTKKRYLALVTSVEEESIILGFNWSAGPKLALVLPIYNATQVQLDGDGGFQLTHPNIRKYAFKPVSVQTLWSANHILQSAIELSRQRNYFYRGQSHSFLQSYIDRIVTEEALFSEWNEIPEVSINMEKLTTFASNEHDELMYKLISSKLREVMMTMDLDYTTCKQIRVRCEEELDMDLKEYKAFLDKEMMYVMGQLDSASKILDHIFLGSEWNASNLKELLDCGVGYILNCTQEVDNFFPDRFTYYNVSVLDEVDTELLRHWDYTYRFITQAVESGSKVLVHCRRGISRSASTVIAYLMKTFGWSLSKSLDFTKTRRDVIQPNSGFMKQLIIYEGMLNSSRNRYNALFGKSLSPKDKRKLLLNMRTSSATSDVSEDSPPSSPGQQPHPEPRPDEVDSVPSRDAEVFFPLDADGAAARSEDAVTESDDGEATPIARSPMLFRSQTDAGASPQLVSSSCDDRMEPRLSGKQKRSLRMQRRQTEAGLDSLTADDVRQDQMHIMNEAMLVLDRRTDMLKSLEVLQVRKGTRFRLERDFTVENTVESGHMRRLSLDNQTTTAHARCDRPTDEEMATQLFREDVEAAPEGDETSDIYLTFLRRSRYNVREDSRRRTFNEGQFRTDEDMCSYDAEKDEPEHSKRREEESVIVTSQFRTVKDSKEWLEQFAKEPSRKPRSPRRRTVGITSISRDTATQSMDNVTDGVSHCAQEENACIETGDTRLSVGSGKRKARSTELLPIRDDAIAEDDDTETVEDDRSDTRTEDTEITEDDRPDPKTEDTKTAEGDPISDAQTDDTETADDDHRSDPQTEDNACSRNVAAKISFRERRTKSVSLPTKLQSNADLAAGSTEVTSTGIDPEKAGCDVSDGEPEEPFLRGFVQERIQSFMSSSTDIQHEKVKRVKSFPGADLHSANELENALVAELGNICRSEDVEPVLPVVGGDDTVTKAAHSDVFLAVSPSEKAAQDVRCLVGRYEHPLTKEQHDEGQSGGEIIPVAPCAEEVSSG